VSIFVPDLIYAGDTLVFDVPDFKDAIGNSISSGTYTLTWYARFNHTHEAAQLLLGRPKAVAGGSLLMLQLLPLLMQGCGHGRQLPRVVRWLIRLGAGNTRSSQQRHIRGSLPPMTIDLAPRLTCLTLRLLSAPWHRAGWCRSTALAAAT
jgi:hypothetical protein